MRLYALILFCGLLSMIWADPDPKKYKPEVKEKNKQSNTTLTADEKKFLREVEEKFGIQTEAPKEEKKEDVSEKAPPPGHFPAVIAIEIVNDTDTKTKGKRTIDANLGYGYKTNNGYTYSYFGKPSQEKGKFMIYPYSQEDIPPGNIKSYHAVHHYEKPNGKHVKTSVEITPSQAFELVPIKDEKPAYNYDKPSIEFKTPSPHGHSGSSYSSHPSTLYTTYNGEQFSGLSGQFPTVMPNYLVDPTQLIKNPEYQNVGLTQDHLRNSHIEQKVVPVLVLRIPSSVLTNPTAELYANLPHNYPLSNYLNSLNLQELVNQYFKKIGYNFAPQVMTYSSPLTSAGVESSAHISQYEPQHYAHPYVQPSYTQSHSSGVQYSAVQPVMARYPSSYTRHHYSVPKGHTLYKQPSLPQKYEYQYQYVQHGAVSSQKFYMPTHYQHQQAEHVATEELRNSHASLAHSSGLHDSNVQVQYEVPTHVTSGYETSVTHDAQYAAPQTNSGAEYASPQAESAAEYAAPQAQVEYETNSVAPEYGVLKDDNSQSLPAGYESAVTASPSHYESPKDSHVLSQEYYSENNQQTQHDSYSAYPSQSAQSEQSQTELSDHQNYVYQHQQQESDDHGLILTENYPSKDHTIATVLPTHYKSGKQSSGTVQTVSYVTPMPHSKYKMPYQVMVPQTFLHNPTTEKVSYVHSQPFSASYSQALLHQDYNPEAEYTIGYHYVPPVGKQKPPSYPRNYHSHPKRMVSKNEKPELMPPAPFSKNKSERNEKKRLS